MDPVKILSVDDEMDLELLLTQYFRRKIRKGEYEFFFDCLTRKTSASSFLTLTCLKWTVLRCSPRLTRCRTQP